ncbi:hypothetical protein BDGGKGIB_04357 [Nodularia sphaerocarpa UHCC 0038]|nr:hypothetical protein BDGGKGIB_04357 [Nodularia sphaerocarpa UHCC 0038]
MSQAYIYQEFTISCEFKYFNTKFHLSIGYIQISLNLIITFQVAVFNNSTLSAKNTNLYAQLIDDCIK